MKRISCRELHLCLLLLGVVAVSGFATLWVLTPTPGLAQENVDRLRHGMSPARVIAILGPPEKRVTHPHTFEIIRWREGETKLTAAFDHIDKSIQQVGLVDVYGDLAIDLEWPGLQRRETLVEQPLKWLGIK